MFQSDAEQVALKQVLFPQSLFYDIWLKDNTLNSC